MDLSLDHTFLLDLRFKALPQGVIAQARFAPKTYDPGLYSKLSINCPAQIARASTKRQIDFLAGRLIARAALMQTKAPDLDLPIGPDRAPVWPAGISGSISHTDQNCAAIIAPRTHLCGIDCEGLLRDTALEAVRAQCLSPSEKVWIARQSRHDEIIATSLIFSAKESIFKTLAPRVQQFFGFDSAEVVDWSEDQSLMFKLTKDLHPSTPKGLVLHAHYDVTDTNVLTWIVMPDPVAL